MKFIYKNYGFHAENPSTCPHCHNGIEPREICQNTEQEIHYSIWKCTFRDCGKQFIAVHKAIGQGEAKFIGFFK